MFRNILATAALSVAALGGVAFAATSASAALLPPCTQMLHVNCTPQQGGQQGGNGGQGGQQGGNQGNQGNGNQNGGGKGDPNCGQWNQDPQWNQCGPQLPPPPKTTGCDNHWGAWDPKCDPTPPPVVIKFPVGCDNNWGQYRDDNGPWNQQQWNDNCGPKFPVVTGCDGSWGKYQTDNFGSWNQGQWNDNCRPPVTPPVVCHGVTTPPIANLKYVRNNTGGTVTVTLTGNYYWVQTEDASGNPILPYPGPNTKTIVLAPGQSISVAWGGPGHQSTTAGPHTWVWTGGGCTLPCHSQHGNHNHNQHHHGLVA